MFDEDADGAGVAVQLLCGVLTACNDREQVALGCHPLHGTVRMSIVNTRNIL